MALREKCVRCGKRMPWVNFWGNIVLVVFKATVGFLGGSQGLIVDSVHSLSDVIATVTVIVTMGIAEKRDDDKYPWGRGKIEFAGAVFIFSLLLLLSISLLIDSVMNIIRGVVNPPNFFAFVAAGLSVAMNYCMSAYAYCAGKRLGSPSLTASALENREDVKSSLAVLVGIIGSNFGLIWLDQAAAVFVALLVSHSAVTLGWASFKQLLDVSLRPEKLALLKQEALRYPGVRRVNFVKARRVGQGVWVDLEVAMDAKMNVVQAYAVVREIRLALLRKFTQIKDTSIAFTCIENTASRRWLNFHPSGALNK